MGTAATPSYFAEFHADSSAPKLTTQPIYTGGSRSAKTLVITKWEADGDVTLYAQTNALAELLLLAMGGTDTVTGTTAPYTHTLSLAQGDLPWFTVQRQFTYGSLIENWIDCKAKNLHLSGKSGGLVDAKLQFAARSIQTVTTGATPTYDAAGEAPFWAGQVTLQRGATTLTLLVEDWEVTLDNQLEVLHTAGQVTPSYISPKVRKVTGKVTATYEAPGDLYLPIYGLSANPPSGQLAVGQVQVQIVSGPQSQIQLTLPIVTYTAAPLHLQPDAKLLTYQIDFTATSTTNAELQAVVTTSQQAAF